MSTPEQLVVTLRQKGIQNNSVLKAIQNTPRHLFVNANLQDKAYLDMPLPLSNQQTISQPFVVARMTELLLKDGPLKKVLEIGTGSGYQAVVLSQLVPSLYTIERIEPLYKKASEQFRQLKIKSIYARFGDGNEGWPEQAPFDGIIVTAGINKVPKKLLQQLADGGRLIIPLGESRQQVLQLITRQANEFKTEHYDPVIFVPLLTGLSH